MRSFEKVWKDQEAKGFKYGRDALEQVRFGYQLAQEEAGFVHKLETGQPDKRPTADEELVGFLGATGRFLDEVKKTLKVQGKISQAQVEAMEQLANFAQRLGEEHRTMYLPYSHMVEKLFNHMNSGDEAMMHAAVGIAGEGGEIIDAIKKVWVYKKPLDPVNLMEEMGDLTFYMQAILNIMGWTWADVRMANRMKLAKRYPDGVYSNEAAQARADKEPGK